VNRRTMLALLVLWVFGALPARSLDTYVVVVHAKNATRSLPKEQVARLFMKKDVRWPDGTKVEPVDRDPEAAVRKSFCQSVHGKDVAAIKSYWQRQLFSGRDTPPPELASDRAVLEYVASHPGAIGYVAAETALPAGVRALGVE
jgi:ABC-type phosphate transport system substrate-binding protein